MGGGNRVVIMVVKVAVMMKVVSVMVMTSTKFNQHDKVVMVAVVVVMRPW